MAFGVELRCGELCHDSPRVGKGLLMSELQASNAFRTTSGCPQRMMEVHRCKVEEHGSKMLAGCIITTFALAGGPVIGH